VVIDHRDSSHECLNVRVSGSSLSESNANFCNAGLMHSNTELSFE
jgi:hypothetical protein